MTVPGRPSGLVTVTAPGGAVVRLREPHDLGFLARWGEVFAVLDDQDSGNLCFGMAGPAGRVFVKYAGARTVRGAYEPADAIEGLRCAADAQRALAHPHLKPLLEAVPTPEGFALVTPWVEAWALGRAYGEAHHIRALPVSTRERLVAEILEFHVHVAAKGWVAVDLYDGSVIVEKDTHRLVLTDLDEYRPGPLTNTVGRILGSTRFMSPEELTLGAPIDEVTNVVPLGGLAFALLGDSVGKDRASWESSEAAFEVAQRAWSRDRGERYQTIAELAAAWDEATGRHRTRG